MIRIDNWPPSQPVLYVDAPDGYLRDVEVAEARLAKARAELRDWERRMRAQRARSWIAYYDKHGWPGPGDRARAVNELINAEALIPR